MSTGQFILLKKYQSSSNVLVEKWGQLSGSSHFIQNAEFTILNMLKTVVSQIIKYIISSSNFMIWPIWWSTLCEVLVDQLMGSFGDFNQGALCTCMPLPINVLNYFFFLQDGNIGKKFYMSTSLRNLTKSIIFLLFLGFVFQIM